MRAADGIELPDAPAPRPHLSATFHPGDRTTYALSWEYAGLGRHRFDDTPGAAGADPDRDERAEAEQAAAVERAWRAAADVVPAAPVTATAARVRAAAAAASMVRGRRARCIKGCTHTRQATGCAEHKDRR